MDLNQAIWVLGLSVAKSDWVWGTTRCGTGTQGCTDARSVPERSGRDTEHAEGHRRLQEHNRSAGNLPEVVGRLQEGIGVHGRVWEEIGVRH